MELGFSLKLYFDRATTLAWSQRLVAAVDERPSLSRVLQIWVAPATPFLADVRAVVAGTPVELAAQNVDSHGRGAFTGGVCAEDLVDVGVTRVVVGHAERRASGETDDDVARKVAACRRAALHPVLCVGEETVMPAEEAAARVLAQVRSAVTAPEGPLTLAYEPVWAIGAAEPAGAGHVRDVCAAVRSAVPGVPVVYGGSARPGLLGDLRPDADGLFLGRYAHDPASFSQLLDDVEAAISNDGATTSRAGSGSARS